ncbi:type VII secretion protein EccB [Cellulomonas denverensis]|uniref:Type VII secretion protein EccB n=1 Tax=Cellulomonas denverensis TaxID=264297 RepID=A0A7X6KSE4_9CELL|nr:type VII secretion protein EccB [Cellulomonas denverensis]NKY21377.1 type VII secretion protein EccB [Cellulomonas denverensis]GIG27056.1 hypothetical protein Cde04nite_33000 [Cellulomonas denverensis]
MASKKDLTEAQSFSRRRLLTAFTSGASGTKELEPAKPLRTVVAGLALSALVVVGGAFYGLVSPGLPDEWEHNRLVLATDTGGRFVSADGTLFPVLNTASARLLIPADDFSIVTTKAALLADLPVGPSLGIVGAPDQLPGSGELIGTGWTACLGEDASTVLTISADPVAASAGSAVVVSTSAGLSVVAGGRHYPLPTDHADAVLRALGLGDAPRLSVDGRWVNLFRTGTALSPMIVPDAGQPLAGTTLPAGQVVHVAGSPPEQRFLLNADGTLASISPLAYQLYLLGTGAQLGTAVEVGATELAEFTNAGYPAGAADWPEQALDVQQGTACALLATIDGSPATVLAAAEGGEDATARAVPVTSDGAVWMDPGAGSVVRAGTGEQAATVLYLIDSTGTAFPVQDDPETLHRLGYQEEDVADVPAPWLQLLPVGPGLSTAAAGTPVAAGSAGTAAGEG